VTGTRIPQKIAGDLAGAQMIGLLLLPGAWELRNSCRTGVTQASRTLTATRRSWAIKSPPSPIPCTR
jgi:hypothetical protein